MGINIKKNKLLLQKRVLLPLVLVEIYLLLTLLLLGFGPLRWNLANSDIFWVLIFLYHIAFILGFCLFFRYVRWSGDRADEASRVDIFILRYFWAFIILALVGSLIGYRHLIGTGSYIPYNFFPDLYEGLINPRIRRAFITSDEAQNNFNGNFSVSLVWGLISFAQYGLIPILVAFWTRLTRTEQMSAILVSLISPVSGISAGTNKPIFDFLFMYLTVFFFHFLSNYNGNYIQIFKHRKIILFSCCLLCFTFWYFDHSMSQRASDFHYLEGVSTPGDIVFKSNGSDELSPLTNAFEKITVYLVQGYYGMSLAIDEDFDSTYGVGHSNFLLREMRDVFGVDLFSKTYQYKISDRWDQFVQWHSFYSQAANDVGFPGVIIVMFALGLWFFIMCHSAIVNSNNIAKCILPFFVLMFVYFPANNQVFNMMNSTLAFAMFNIIWILNQLLNFKSTINR